MRRNAGYYLYVFIVIIVLAIGTIAWQFIKKDIVNKYVEESGIALMTESEIEELKEEAYQEGYDDGIAEGYDDGYESALEEYNVDPGISYATVYYVDDGDSYHMNSSCLSLRQSKKTVHETTLDKLQGSLNPCDICVPHSDN